jgi:hypothetical protein
MSAYVVNRYFERLCEHLVPDSYNPYPLAGLSRFHWEGNIEQSPGAHFLAISVRDY